jgi:hypothetical protein
MSSADLGVERIDSSELIVQSLPDGSAAIFETSTKNVYSLNATAAAAWEACATATTLPQVAAAMSARLTAPVTEEVAHVAVSELEAAGLVRVTSAAAWQTSRRAMLKQVAGVAIPMVLVLTGAEQRAHAQGNGSGPIITTTPGGGTTQPPSGPPGFFSFVKRIRNPDGSTEPAVGFTFELRTGTGQVVHVMVTDGSGFSPKVQVNPGTYLLVETADDGGNYEPFEPRVITVLQGQDVGRDITNVRIAD